MKKPSLPTLSPTLKRLVLLAAGACILLGLVGYGMAQAAQARQEQARKAAYESQERAAGIKRLSDRIVALEGQNKLLEAQKKASCDYLQTLTTNPKTKPVVVVPPSCK